jgi:NDP-sugar pyrophosphorylase family protein
MTDFLQGLINEKYKLKAILIKNGWLELDSMQDYEIYNKLYQKGKISNFLNIENTENEMDLK